MRALIVVLLLLGAHLSQTANVPAPAGQSWLLWPFAADSRPAFGIAGEAVVNATHLLAAVAGAGFLAAALSLFDLIFPVDWFMPITLTAVVASLLLHTLYLGPWAVLPLMIDALLIWSVLSRPWSATGVGNS
ncbi:MAG: hypothetical protein HY329_10855 [Chloroflexi bacterium]|nr:hypothetical protein [Chloroflexota bacterium]